MKIGILTFHYAHNYGAFLQAYALQETLRSKGHEVLFLDYKLPSISTCYKWLNPKLLIRKNPFKVINGLCQLSKKKKRHDVFVAAINGTLKEDTNSLSHINEFETIIAGSDQIWNLNLAREDNNAYWGWLSGYKNNLISYAASMEQIELNQSQRDFVKSSLNNFHSLSVRESSLKALLQKFTDKEIHVDVDPTLLMPKDFWCQFAKSPMRKKKYVLLYQVRPTHAALDIATEIAQKKGCELVVLSASADAINSKEALGAGPKEFLGLIRDAAYVVSTSFHGLVFSLIFNKPFCSYLADDGKNSRVESLLEATQTQKFGVKKIPEDIESLPDWDSVNAILEKLRLQSLTHLNSAI